jgi:glutamate formiminotransferase
VQPTRTELQRERDVLECVINISEGRRPAVIEAIGERAGPALLDVHTDGHHHRSVLTVVGTDAPRAIAEATLARVDLRDHDGVHPRIGALDVVPFVPLGGSSMTEALEARDAFTEWAAAELGLPCFRYGSERSLPDVRRHAWKDLVPDTGPSVPHPTAGATAVGARPVLVAYNLWLADADLDRARAIARSLRGPAVRALGLAVGDHVQVSMNLIDPTAVGPAAVYDAVAAQTGVERAELVGLAPASVFDAVDPTRWSELDLTEDRTIEARLSAQGWPAD